MLNLDAAPANLLSAAVNGERQGQLRTPATNLRIATSGRFEIPSITIVSGEPSFGCARSGERAAQPFVFGLPRNPLTCGIENQDWHASEDALRLTELALDQARLKFQRAVQRTTHPSTDYVPLVVVYLLDNGGGLYATNCGVSQTLRLYEQKPLIRQ